MSGQDGFHAFKIRTAAGKVIRNLPQGIRLDRAVTPGGLQKAENPQRKGAAANRPGFPRPAPRAYQHADPPRPLPGIIDGESTPAIVSPKKAIIHTGG